jgi:hypothetical protein
MNNLKTISDAQNRMAVAASAVCLVLSIAVVFLSIELHYNKATAGEIGDCNARIEAVESLLQTSEEMYAQEKKNCDDFLLQQWLEGNPVTSLRYRMTHKCPAECACVEDAQKELDVCTIQRGACERWIKEEARGNENQN